jgi:uncharacterized membrane protein
MADITILVAAFGAVSTVSSGLGGYWISGRIAGRNRGADAADSSACPQSCSMWSSIAPEFVERPGDQLAQAGVVAVVVDELLGGGQRLLGAVQPPECATPVAERLGDLLTQGGAGVVAVVVDELLGGAQRLLRAAQIAKHHAEVAFGGGGEVGARSNRRC